MFGGKKDINAKNGSTAIDNSGVGNKLDLTVLNQSKLTSLLNPLLVKIIDEFDFDEGPDQLEMPEVETKISFNAVKVYADEIRDSTGYMSLIEELIDNIDDENPNAKKKFLGAIHKNYKNHKKDLLIEHSIDPSDNIAVQSLICENADKLIQAVAKTILNHAAADVDAPVELVESAQELIVGFGFINCKILEPHA